MQEQGLSSNVREVPFWFKPSTGLSMADAAYGGGAAAAPSMDSSVPCKDSRDTLYSFDEAKLDLIRKTKPWTQE